MDFKEWIMNIADIWLFYPCVMTLVMQVRWLWEEYVMGTRNKNSGSEKVYLGRNDWGSILFGRVRCKCAGKSLESNFRSGKRYA